MVKQDLGLVWAGLRTSVFAALLEMIDALAYVALSCNGPNLSAPVHAWLSAIGELLDGPFESLVFPKKRLQTEFSLAHHHRIRLFLCFCASVLLEGHP